MPRDFDMDSPEGRADWRVHHAMRGWNTARRHYGLSHDEMRDAFTRRPYGFRDTDNYDLSNSVGRGMYRGHMLEDMFGTAGRYHNDRRGYHNVLWDPSYDVTGYGGYRRR